MLSGLPLEGVCDFKGGTISWEEIGIEIEIPPRAVPKGRNLELSVRPCLSGPFILPNEYQLASPVYLITPAFEFTRKVKLSIAHFAGLDRNKDSDRMTFISASSLPVYAPQAKYEFKVMKGGIFKKKEHHGFICLKHFCLTGCAQPVSGSVNDYSVQLYQSLEPPMSMFSVSLCHPVYAEVREPLLWGPFVVGVCIPCTCLATIIGVQLYFPQHLKNEFKEAFPGIKFDRNIVEPRRILGSHVVLEIPDNIPDCEIAPDRLPPAVRLYMTIFLTIKLFFSDTNFVH